MAMKDYPLLTAGATINASGVAVGFHPPASHVFTYRGGAGSRPDGAGLFVDLAASRVPLRDIAVSGMNVLAAIRGIASSAESPNYQAYLTSTSFVGSAAEYGVVVYAVDAIRRAGDQSVLSSSDAALFRNTSVIGTELLRVTAVAAFAQHLWRGIVGGWRAVSPVGGAVAPRLVKAATFGFTRAISGSSALLPWVVWGAPDVAVAPPSGRKKCTVVLQRAGGATVVGVVTSIDAGSGALSVTVAGTNRVLAVVPVDPANNPSSYVTTEAEPVTMVAQWAGVTEVWPDVVIAMSDRDVLVVELKTTSTDPKNKARSDWRQAISQALAVWAAATMVEGVRVWCQAVRAAALPGTAPMILDTRAFTARFDGDAARRAMLALLIDAAGSRGAVVRKPATSDHHTPMFLPVNDDGPVIATTVMASAARPDIATKLITRHGPGRKDTRTMYITAEYYAVLCSLQDNRVYGAAGRALVVRKFVTGPNANGPAPEPRAFGWPP